MVLAMSGGVDSSVAAHLLLSQGHEVVGVFMRHGGESHSACETAPPGAGPAAERSAAPLLPVLQERSDHKQGCCSASDALDGRRVADRLQIPFYALDLQEDFDRIIDYFVDEYTRGRTPNPCVVCNNWLKFGRLFDYADSIGADYVATGHYARLSRSKDGAWPALRRGIDSRKDQSYVLFGIEREFLPRMLLPVGGYHKSVIREIAGQLGLKVAEKKDSQEICFVTSGQHDEFVRRRRGARVDTSGEIVTVEGQVVGRHPGLEGFTIGQRKGLGVALGEPRYVVRLEPETRRVVIGALSDLGRQELTASQTNWLVEPPRGPFRCLAQIRYNSAAAPAEAELLPDGRLRVMFDSPRMGVAPGQAVVCYEADRVLGGGWID